MQQQDRTGQHTKKQHGFSRSNKPVHFTWPALLADQTGDGENFMNRYDVQRQGLHGASVIVTVSRNVRWFKKLGSKFKTKAGRGVRPASVQR
jgi:hypothetical protein